MKFKVKVSAYMEFEIESECEHSVNGDATNYVINNMQDFTWYFEEIKIKEGKN